MVGFRFRASGIGVLMVGRQAGEAPSWPVVPTSTVSTRVGKARISGNDFQTLPSNPLVPPSASVACAVSGGDDVTIENNVVRGAGTGIWVEEASGANLSGNVISEHIRPACSSSASTSWSTSQAIASPAAELWAPALPSRTCPTPRSPATNSRSTRSAYASSNRQPLSGDDLASVAALGGVVIGGQPATGNVIAGADQALMLDNAGGVSLTRTMDISATYNAWGTAYAPFIEARVRHAFDDPRLGRAYYWPALSVPTRLGVSATPDILPAEGRAPPR